MARTCFIHIGMHKTGSSSIQETLFDVRDLGSLYYADISGEANHSGPLISIFSKNADKHHANIKRGLTGEEIRAGRDRMLNGLSTTIAAQPEKDLVISGEGICQLAEDELESLRNLLSGAFSNLRVIGYVRSPKAYMESAFQQVLKGVVPRLDPASLYPQYRARFEKFDRVFCRDNVLLRPFDTALFPAGCVVRDFCAIIGADLPHSRIIRVNESLSRHAVSLLLAYRRHGPGFGVGPGMMKENARLVEVLGFLQGPKLRFSDSLVASVLQRNEDDIRWMEERLGGGLPEESPADERGVIRSEEELFQFDPGTLCWLAENIGVPCEPNATPLEVAGQVHQLRLRLKEAEAERRRAMRAGRRGPRGNEIRAEDLVSGVKREVPVLFALTDLAAAELLREVFRLIAAKVDAATVGTVGFDAFGHFRLVGVETVKDRKRSLEKRVIFQPWAKPYG